MHGEHPNWELCQVVSWGLLPSRCDVDHTSPPVWAERSIYRDRLNRITRKDGMKALYGRLMVLELKPKSMDGPDREVA